MKLNVDFRALYKAIAPLGAVRSDLTLTRRSDSLESVANGLVQGKVLGKDIQLDEIDGSNGVLSYDGHQVMLYIPDQGPDVDQVINNGKCKSARRVHIAECKTIIGMREKGRFHNRYVVTSRIDGKFSVFGRSFHSGRDSEGESDLSPCIMCMKQLNVEGYTEKTYNAQKLFIANFSFIRLFESYSSYFKTMPTTTADYYSGGYSSDWSSISSALRSEVNYACQQCGVCLKEHKKILHAHHINGNKADNKRANLRALCADCHKKQPHHGHLYVSNETTLTINRLRAEQGVMSPSESYQELILYADPALIGLISKCQKNRLSCGKSGVSTWIKGNEVSIDLCWENQKVAVVINHKSSRDLKDAGWSVYTVQNALDRFDLFQSEVR
ncbi:HNH endonuclease [Vibrio tapetis subsp. quintayensis]|uniref:HNH endonuclease n=1 Tax=Vibrio tapetis TaxID=52443 RepID=UPI0025B3924B|nr:HNH endonuclease [Vibrio tapetis]MDN3683196.1 HNH endonuclease [Vibrio tapetis subsp. quintayensis]